MIHRFFMLVAAGAALLSAGPTAQALSPTGDFLLISRDLSVSPVRLVEINEQLIEIRDADDKWDSIPLRDCLALLDPDIRPSSMRDGLLVLVDGQRLPGKALSSTSPGSEVLAWSHSLLGRLEIPLASVRRVQLVDSEHTVQTPDADVVVMQNGDQLEGFITSIGDPISIELTNETGKQVVDIPLDLAAAVYMVTPEQPPSGKRVWLSDGTVLTVTSIQAGDDASVRLTSMWTDSGTQPPLTGFGDIAAILLDARSMMPLASLTPSRVEGPSSRYVLPQPILTQPNAPLGLSPIEYRGPLVARYTLPEGASRFAAVAMLKDSARDWGDFDLIITCDDQVLTSVTLSRENMHAEINVPLNGVEIGIELTPGAHGPIQDHLVLERAMILIDAP